MAAPATLTTAAALLQNHVATTFTFMLDASRDSAAWLRRHFQANNVAGGAIEVAHSALMLLASSALAVSASDPA